MPKGYKDGKPIKPCNSFDSISPEKAEEIRAKGRIASSKIRKERKKLKEELELLLEICDKKGISNQEKISIALIKEAEKGNVKAYETIRDTIGQKPVDKQEVTNIDLKWFK